LAFIAGMSETETDPLTFIYVETPEVGFLREELRQNADSPASLSHDRLDQRGDFAERV